MFGRRIRIRQKLRPQFRRALADRDIPALMHLSSLFMPVGQQPRDEAEATVFMHVARVTSDWLDVEARSYSHFWLIDHGLPSLLPPHLLPKAERYRPEIAASVGIACGTGKAWLKPALPLIRGAMVKAVEDNAELVETDPDLLRDKIQFARRDEFQRLFGAYDATEVER